MDPTPIDPATTTREALRAAVRDAMRARDRERLAALRGAVSAIDQAEAVDPTGHVPAVGGSGDVPRRVLTTADVARVLRAEIDEHRAAADAARGRGDDDTVARLDARAGAVEPFVPLP